MGIMKGGGNGGEVTFMRDKKIMGPTHPVNLSVSRERVFWVTPAQF